MSETKNSEWIKHDGGKMPVPAGTMVDVKFGDGEIDTNTPADYWFWIIDNDPNAPGFGDGAGIITHYRVVKP